MCLPFLNLFLVIWALHRLIEEFTSAHHLKINLLTDISWIESSPFMKIRFSVVISNITTMASANWKRIIHLQTRNTLEKKVASVFGRIWKLLSLIKWWTKTKQLTGNFVINWKHCRGICRKKKNAYYVVILKVSCSYTIIWDNVLPWSPMKILLY